MNSQSAAGQKIDTSFAQEKDVTKGPLTGREIAAPQADKDKSDKKAPGAFRTISEVAEDLDVQQHVLRFWETKFSQIRPLKRGGGRRYYRPEDLALLKRIHYLLYTEGYTIKGVQKLLKEKGKGALMAEAAPAPQNSNEPVSAPAVQAAAPSVQASVQGSVAGLTSTQRQVLHAMLGELKEIRRIVKPD